MRLIVGGENFCEAECTKAYMTEQKFETDTLAVHRAAFTGVKQGRQEVIKILFAVSGEIPPLSVQNK